MHKQNTRAVCIYHQCKQNTGDVYICIHRTLEMFTYAYTEPWRCLHMHTQNTGDVYICIHRTLEMFIFCVNKTLEMFKYV